MVVQEPCGIQGPSPCLGAAERAVELAFGAEDADGGIQKRTELEIASHGLY